MIENWLEVTEYSGEGYRILVEFGDWRVAILRFIDELYPENVTMLERHCETDEVFVLLNGRGTLLLAGDQPVPGDILSRDMAFNKIYNVRCNVWHGVLLSSDATVLIVENRDTGDINSQRYSLSLEQCQKIIEYGQACQFYDL